MSVAKRAEPTGQQVTLLLVLSVALGCAGYFEIFSQFSVYDDEGQLLLTLRDFVSGHPLYDGVTSQYGPAYFILHRLLYAALSVSPTHDNIRLLTLVLWSLGSLGHAVAVLRITRSPMYSAIALAATFIGVAGLCREPGYPGTTLFVLSATATALATSPERRHTLPSLAVVCAIACLIKTNVGGLLTLAVFWTCVGSRSGGLKPLRWSIACGIALFPALLMSQRIATAQIALFVVVATAAVVATLLLRPDAPVSSDRSRAARFIAPLLAALTVLAACTLLLGTGLQGLVYGVVTQHIDFATQFYHDPPIGWTVVPLAAMALIASRWASRRGTESTPRPDFAWPRAIGTIVVGLVALSFALFRFGPMEYSTLNLAYFLPWTWLIMVSGPSTATTRGAQSRYALLSISSLIVLQAYPVAATQLLFATAPMISIACVLLHDASVGIADSTAPSPARRLGIAATAVLAIGLVSFSGWDHFQFAQARYRLGHQPIGLAGASRLRLAEPFLANAEGLTLNLASDANTLLTVPGMYSFHLWSGVASPTLSNTREWVYETDTTTQRSIAASLEASSTNRILLHSGLIAFWNRAGRTPSGPLISRIKSEFGVLLRTGGYALLAPKSQLDTARIIGARWRGAALPTGLQRATIRFAKSPATLHRLEVVDPVANAPIQIAETKHGKSIAVRPDGLPARTLTLRELADPGIPLDPPVELTVFVRTKPRQRAWVRGFDRDGVVITRLPFVEAGPAIPE